MTANNDQDSAATATATTSDSLVEIKSPAQIQLEKVGSIDPTDTIITIITDIDDYKSILYDWSVTWSIDSDNRSFYGRIYHDDVEAVVCDYEEWWWWMNIWNDFGDEWWWYSWWWWWYSWWWSWW